ncbi:hypothetical protein DCAR_0936108 [Daucus carota subsp. sativus]|uniref:NB-ARC domain-containing protein n=1 Tax=Daucus carota subsp. sativus TaxID=79200 RepID=A0AAF1BHG7_DAUCS|nr:hypothetical protein DCAR_0936108 [Daucus carota subsp. sativus]
MLSSGRSTGVTKIGIHGMGGVGKTTLARAVFDKIYFDFKGSCFLANVTANSGTDEGMKSLQQQLLNDVLFQNEKDVKDVASGIKLIETKLADQKILVVIDDLNHSDQLESFGVKSFGHGSVVIITTREEDMLKYFEVKTEHRYMVDKLGCEESLILFQQHAFRFGSNPDGALMKLSKDITLLADGLPLALKVFGSLLHTKYEVEEWEEFIERLKETPNREIEDSLLISFQAINGDLQKMFLDIACFFIGWGIEKVFQILETYYSYVKVKINNLKGKCLLTIDDKNVLHMHDLLRDMGMQVARNNSPGNPEKYSRLWLSRDIDRVLTEENKGLQLTTEIFKKMKNLRFLHLIDFQNPIGSFDNTFKDLRWLSGKRCPLEYFPPDFKPTNLGILELRYSRMRTMELNMVFQKLKILNMEYSSDLMTTPDFNMFPSLVDLNFAYCRSLKKIHRSIGRLAGLVSLNLGGCWMLASLPKTIGNLKALKHLNLFGSASLGKLPENLPESLENLNIGMSGLKSLPHSIHLLGNLIELDVPYNSELITLPDNICKLRSLQYLIVSACKNLKALPEDLGDITSLRVLRMKETSVSDLPGSIGNLSNLVELILGRNPNLETLADTICNLRSLEILTIGSCEKLKELPGQMWKITSLRELCIRNTTMLKVEANQIPISLKKLDLSYKAFTTLPLGINLNFANCKNLKQIHRSIGSLAGLVSLDLGSCSKLASLPETIGNLKALKHLFLWDCTSLEKLPEELVNIESLENLYIRNAGLKNLPHSIHLLRNLVELKASRNSELITLPDNICKLRSLKVLDVSECNNLKALPEDLGDITSLRVLRMRETSVSDLPGSIGNLGNLVELILNTNPNLEILPDAICNLRSLEILTLRFCEKLQELPGQMRKITSLRELDLCGTTMLKLESNQIPISLKTLDLSCNDFTALPLGISQLTNLERLEVDGCTQLLSIEELPPNLKRLGAYGWPSMTLKQLEILKLTSFSGLEVIQNLY